ncbi:MAG: hypothetical protein AABX35_04580 [Nanoarchaeota archaeon]
MAKDKTISIIIAIFLSFFTFIYTWNTDKAKFWWCLALEVLLFWTFVVPVGIWIYTLYITCSRDSNWYKKCK